MSDRARTDDGKPIGGWVLRADPGAFDVAATLAEFGQVFRFPLDPNDRTDLLDAGQPCFLFSADTSKVVGIWAIGEVVAPPTLIELEGADGSVQSQLYAEVELLPLAKPISVDKLTKHKVLAQGELLTAPGRENPIVLRPEEVRAIEEFEFDFVEPTEEQIARVEEVLGQEDGMIFQLVGTDQSFGIMDDGSDDELLSVVTVSEEGAFELGRFEAFGDALDLIRLQGAGLELDDPVPLVEGLPDGPPVAVLQVEDGLLSLYRVGPTTFDLYDPTEDGELEAVGRFESLDTALAGLAEAIEEVDDDETPTDEA
jgi:hypothetical protein